MESYKESRELITAVNGSIDDLIKDHMAAIVDESPVECFIVVMNFISNWNYFVPQEVLIVLLEEITVTYPTIS